MKGFSTQIVNNNFGQDFRHNILAYASLWFHYPQTPVTAFTLASFFSSQFQKTETNRRIHFKSWCSHITTTYISIKLTKIRPLCSTENGSTARIFPRAWKEPGDVFFIFFQEVLLLSCSGIFACANGWNHPLRKRRVLEFHRQVLGLWWSSIFFYNKCRSKEKSFELGRRRDRYR